MVNSPLIRPYLLEGVALGGGYLRFPWYACLDVVSSMHVFPTCQQHRSKPGIFALFRFRRDFTCAFRHALHGGVVENTKVSNLVCGYATRYVFFSGNLKFVINNVELFKKVFEFHMIHVFCLNVDWQQRGLFDYLFTYTYIVRTSKECCRFSIKCSFQQECFKRNIYRMNPQKAYAKIS